MTPLRLRALTPLAIPFLLATATAPTTAIAAGKARTVPSPVMRLAIADARQPELRITALDGRTLLTTTLAAPASSVVPLGDQRHVAAVQYAADRVDLVDGGSWTEDHGDHLHSFVAGPRALSQPLTAADPAHLIAHEDEVLVFADGAGEVHRYGLDALVSGKRTHTTLSAYKPHHGVAVPFGARFLITTPAPAGALPNGVALVDAQSRELQRFTDCPLLHGESSGDDWAAFGCGDGTLLIDGTDAPTARKLPYPRALGTARVGTWNASPSGRHLVGAAGASGVLVVDRKTATQRVVPLGATVHAVSADPSRARAVALTRDGRLHLIDLGSGDVLHATQAMPAFTPASGEGALSPRLATAPGRVAVSDPASGRVLVFRSTKLRRTLAQRIGTAPQALAFIGAPVAHDH